MIGSSLYFIALLATAELEIAENPTPDTVAAIIESDSTSLGTAPEITESVEQEATTPCSAEATKSMPVTITNGIEPSMLSYKHWTGTYSPDVFTVYINETVTEPGQTYVLTDQKTPVIIRFDYSFMNGMRKGTKTTTYKINDQITTATLTFSWLDTHKTLLDNATIAPEAV